MPEHPVASTSTSYASNEVPASVRPTMAVPAETSVADDVEQQFTDDLIAANRFKTFLIGRGIEVPKEVTEGLAKLVAKYLDDQKTVAAELPKKVNVRSKKTEFAPSAHGREAE